MYAAICTEKTRLLAPDGSFGADFTGVGVTTGNAGFLLGAAARVAGLVATLVAALSTGAVVTGGGSGAAGDGVTGAGAADIIGVVVVTVVGGATAGAGAGRFAHR